MISPTSSPTAKNGLMSDDTTPNNNINHDDNEDEENDELPTNSHNEVRSFSPQNICSKDHFKKNKIIEPQPKPQLHHSLLATPALTRALSQPQLFNISPVKISSPHKGIMQKFIASRGKLNVKQVNQPIQSNNFKKNLIMVCCA